MGKHFSGAETKERYRLTVTSNYFQDVVHQKNQGIKKHALTTFFMSISCIMPKIMRPLHNPSDEKGNLWPVLSMGIAYERAAKYAKTKDVVIAHGILFFPGEAGSGRQLRLQILEIDTGRVHVIRLDL